MRARPWSSRARAGCRCSRSSWPKALGAWVIATTSGPAKAARLLEIGADDVIDYRATPDWPARVRELTGGQGADRVVDVAGLVDQSLKLWRSEAMSPAWASSPIRRRHSIPGCCSPWARPCVLSPSAAAHSFSR
ncbi:zinc-binding dehydrogenase [Nonomuraea sp. NPDC003754]